MVGGPCRGKLAQLIFIHMISREFLQLTPYICKLKKVLVPEASHLLHGKKAGV